MNYWFIIDDTRIGPLTLSEVERLDITPLTPTWRDGMPDWLNAADVPEVAEILARKGYELYPGARRANPVATEADPYRSACQPCSEPVKVHYTPVAEPTSAYAGQPEQLPASHMVWSILVTILCCLPLGIVAIIYSSKVSAANSVGDIEKARRMANRADWFIILSIVLGLLSLPVSLAFNIL